MPEVAALAPVFVSGNWVEVWTAQCALEGYGIPTLSVGDYLCRLTPSYALFLGGVTVLVAREDLEAAEEIVALNFPGAAPHVGSTLSVPLSLWALIGMHLLRWARKPRGPASLDADGESALN